MSNFLAIAAVTEAFRQVLNDAATASGIAGASATAVRPTSGANNGQTGNPPVVGVNLYLYQITPNGAFRNTDAPTRRSDGSVLQPTRAAYDLHYLLTFYGSDLNYEPQRVLGSVLRALHAAPVLTRKRLESVKMSFAFLANSNIELEPETVKLTLLPLNLEELSKLWSVFFQIPYSLSLAFQASVVILDGTEAASPALPVLSRNLYVRPFQQPVIEQVLSQKSPAETPLPNQPILVGETLVLQGRQLRGDPSTALTRVRIGDQEITPGEISETEIKFVLDMPPFAAQSLRAGVQGVQVIQPSLLGTPPVEHPGAESNVAAFVVRPAITASVTPVSNHVVDGVTFCTADLTLNFTPRVGVTQRVIVLLNEFNPPAARPARAYRFAAPFTPPSPSDTSVASLVAHVVEVAAGDYLLRALVDGAESLLDPGPDPANPLFSAPKVTIS
jgi:hypothetical protein